VALSANTILQFMTPCFASAVFSVCTVWCISQICHTVSTVRIEDLQVRGRRRRGRRRRRRNHNMHCMDWIDQSTCWDWPYNWFYLRQFGLAPAAHRSSSWRHIRSSSL
jgi:hypothetical protein